MGDLVVRAGPSTRAAETRVAALWSRVALLLDAFQLPNWGKRAGRSISSERLSNAKYRSILRAELGSSGDLDPRVANRLAERLLDTFSSAARGARPAARRRCAAR